MSRATRHSECHVVAADSPLAALGIDAYRVVRDRRRRRLSLLLDREGEPELRVPWAFPRARIPALMDAHADWLRRARARFARQTALEAPPVAEHAALRAETLRWVEAYLDTQWYGPQPSRITVRLMKTRWGSCSSSGRISLNLLLARLPESLREYVLVHELMHLVHLDHSPAFWAALGATLPDYQARRRALRDWRIAR